MNAVDLVGDILIIDPDPPLIDAHQRLAWLDATANLLRDAGHRVRVALSVGEGFDRALADPPDAILLHLSCVTPECLVTCEQLHEATGAPLIVLPRTGAPGELSRVLDAGAAVLLTTPLDDAELLARMKAILRRARAPKTQRPPSDTVSVGDIEISLTSREVRKGGRAVNVSPTEFRLLALLLNHAGKVMSHRRLLTEVWGPEYVNDTQYLRTYVRSLREKIESNPERPRIILTERGVGYFVDTKPAGHATTVAKSG